MSAVTPRVDEARMREWRAECIRKRERDRRRMEEFERGHGGCDRGDGPGHGGFCAQGELEGVGISDEDDDGRLRPCKGEGVDHRGR
jgi:hypothetical protein